MTEPSTTDAPGRLRLLWAAPWLCLALARDPDGALIARWLWAHGSGPWRRL